MATTKKSEGRKPSRTSLLLQSLLAILPVIVGAFERDTADEAASSIIVRSKEGKGNASVSILKDGKDLTVMEP